MPRLVNHTPSPQDAIKNTWMGVATGRRKGHRVQKINRVVIFLESYQRLPPPKNPGEKRLAYWPSTQQYVVETDYNDIDRYVAMPGLPN